MTPIPALRALAVAAAATVALFAGGCGSGTPPDDRTVRADGGPRSPEPLPDPDASERGAYGDLSSSPSPPSEPPPGPACPEDGLKLRAGAVNAAMGLRAMSVTLTNCGGRPHEANGYPVLRMLDEERKPQEIEFLKGTEPVTALDDPGPRPITLRPGDSVTSVVVWRNTYTDTTREPLDGTYLSVALGPGGTPRLHRPEGSIDTGSTGRIGTTAWARSDGLGNPLPR